jgi:hypothetical protein
MDTMCSFCAFLVLKQLELPTNCLVNPEVGLNMSRKINFAILWQFIFNDTPSFGMSKDLSQPARFVIFLCVRTSFSSVFDTGRSAWSSNVCLAECASSSSRPTVVTTTTRPTATIIFTTSSYQAPTTAAAATTGSGGSSSTELPCKGPWARPLPAHAPGSQSIMATPFLVRIYIPAGFIMEKIKLEI